MLFTINSKQFTTIIATMQAYSGKLILLLHLLQSTLGKYKLERKVSQNEKFFYFEWFLNSFIMTIVQVWRNKDCS
jgi:hypothetical protein